MIALLKRLLLEVDLRLLVKAGWNLGVKGVLTVERFKRRQRRGGSTFPAFVMISVTGRCTLSCQGCWVSTNTGEPDMDPELLHRVISVCKSQGTSFFGILGGEPLLYPELFSVLARHPDAYFQLFTNGIGLTDEVAARLRRLGHVTPIISVEGSAGVSDERRGGEDVLAKTMAGLDACRRNRLFFGVATSVCRSNRKDLVSESFVEECVRHGAHYLWYYFYRPVGPRPARELALTEEEILELRRFMVNIRLTAPLMVVDAYWDGDGRAVCPGAMGLSHHINPRGDLEFCPPLQFADETVGSGDDLAERFAASRLLSEMRRQIPAASRGCILMEDPQRLKKMMEELNARDSSGRGTAMAELAAMTPCPGHHLPGREIPEKSWLYRFCKRYWFFGFGAYG